MEVGGVGALVLVPVPMPGEEGKDEVDGPISGPGLEEGGREGRLEEGGGGKGAMAVSSNCG